ncbi:hypothetical protein [Thalassospira sp. MCCC 1A02491]|uniref:hypothetical protein n=1 Tax=Thalassospira sp. MCCC 1A02491 TaxID=1769751 RepID=UPI0007AD706D|nr:hypothetical protein [Thalassospira sp. MCCC 1A02491]KZB67197.1 hypothetical protein AUQ42_12975 [Thalassospira sp. MCCC 1A02491]
MTSVASSRRKRALRIDANFTEDVVGFALESFLTAMSFPSLRFTIEPFSRDKERWLGADARLHSRISGFRPFYMQFKRPSAYPDFSTAGIIKDRKNLKLGVSPRALYFDLRAKKDHHHDFQHNILFKLRRRLRNRGIGEAAYVCPLFLDRAAYRSNLHWAGLLLWRGFWKGNPWSLEKILLHHGRTVNHFERIPVLAEHITVPPHVDVTSAKHRYSFTESGTDLCFHSPQSLPEGVMSFAKFLSVVCEGFTEDGNKIQPNQANQELYELIKATEAAVPDELRFDEKDDDFVGNWFAWGDHLLQQYGIQQYALVSWED